MCYLAQNELANLKESIRVKKVKKAKIGQVGPNFRLNGFGMYHKYKAWVWPIYMSEFDLFTCHRPFFKIRLNLKVYLKVYFVIRHLNSSANL